jgi:hypothetical protein
LAPLHGDSRLRHDDAAGEASRISAQVDNYRVWLTERYVAPKKIEREIRDLARMLCEPPETGGTVLPLRKPA